MSTLLWFILITAFMFFMHRGRGSMGGCGRVHSHTSHDRTSSGRTFHDGYKSKPDFSNIAEAEYEVID